jgi:hypothetical protein
MNRYGDFIISVLRHNDGKEARVLALPQTTSAIFASPLFDTLFQDITLDESRDDRAHADWESLVSATAANSNSAQIAASWGQSAFPLGAKRRFSANLLLTCSSSSRPSLINLRKSGWRPRPLL